MAAKTQTKTDEKREYVVVNAMRRGLNLYHTFHGPFTKGEASAYAMHGVTYGDGEFTVEHVTPLHHHERWKIRESHS